MGLNAPPAFMQTVRRNKKKSKRAENQQTIFHPLNLPIMTRLLKLALVAIIVLATNFFSSFLYSQDTGFYRNMKEKADFVFEGEIVKSTGKWNSQRTMIYTEHQIRLTKVFKGDLRENSIRLVTPGGETPEGQFVIAGDALQLNEGQKGIFFAREEPLGMLGENRFGRNTFFADNPKGFVAKRFDERGPIPLGYGALHQKEKYDKILAELGQVIVQYPYVPTGNPFSETGCDDPAYQTSAEITFENIGVTGNFQNVELDIMIKGLPQGVKFGKCEFSLTFPTDVFGENLVQNNMLTVTKGEVVQSTDFVLTASDEANDKVKITVQLASGILASAASLTGNVEKLLHCSFGVADPSGLPNLKASDFILTGNVWYECDRSLYPFRNVIIKTEGDVVTPNFENLIGISYNLQKFHFRTVGANQLLRVDIYANSGELSLFRTAELYIDFGADAFPSFLSTNNLVSIVMGDLIGGMTNVGGTPTPNYQVFDSDQSANTLKITISPNPAVGDAGLAQLGNEPVWLLSLNISVNDCMKAADLEWNNLTNNINHTYLEGSDIFQYLPVTYTGGLATTICGCNLPDPVITGFSEAQVRAGVGERLTIQGNHFGEVIVEGSCFIQVRDGDGSSSMKTQILNVDIID